MEEIIVKYIGDIGLSLDKLENVEYSLLYGNFAVISYPHGMLAEIIEIPEIQYIQYPVRLYFQQNEYKGASCITNLTEETGLTGKNIIVAVIDSGIDLIHNAFRNEDGTTRFLFYWNQSGIGKPPEGYYSGTEYNNSEINELLFSNDNFFLLPKDNSGHGTAVAGIAAGNDHINGYKGVAPDAFLIGVALGTSKDYPKTPDLMQAVDYCIKKAMELKSPIVINLSFGNSYGDHTGNSLLEDYLNLACTIGKTCIVAGTGNEGSAASHAGGLLLEPSEILLSVGSFQNTFSIQLWKSYADNVNINITTPSGETTGDIDTSGQTLKFSFTGTDISILIGRPTPIQLRQGIYIEISPGINSFVEQGIYIIRITPNRISSNRFDMWLPTSEILSRDTRFLTPDVNVTLTIPSTASNIISVGAYNSSTNVFSPFSGRGYTAIGGIKPDIIAPGEGISAPLSGFGQSLYSTFSGTSFSTPIVSGSCALMMEWGIIRGNDSNMYGQKIKAYLQKGARPLSDDIVPNPREGYGRLCLSDSLRF